MTQAFRWAVGACALAASAGLCPASAQTVVPKATEPSQDAGIEPTASNPSYAIHAQSTFTVQGTPAFASPYAGANSLAPKQARETWDVTLYAGVQPWRGAEIWVNPEIDQGFGLSDTLGVAGFPSGEAYKVGNANPYFKLPRLFLRQTLDLGGAADAVEGSANQLAGHRSGNRIVITLGKFSVPDVFDTNAYAHDPRGDFLNWALIDTGTFDYAANAWGFTFGGAIEWYHGRWTLRAGMFNLSKEPNQTSLETDLSQRQIIGELERRHTIAGHAGAVRIGVWQSRGRFVLLADAIAAYTATGSIPDLATLRKPATKWGAQLNAEQEVNANFGLFLRAGYGDGKAEADDFTDIDRTLAVGGQLKGALWGRAEDRIGLAGVVSGISRQHQQFFADGGMGILVGDGVLPRPGNEWITEAYYAWQIGKAFILTADYQFIANPAYNRDRGPAHVFGIRLHAGF